MAIEIDRDQLADFLRRRREALRPEDVGLPAGPRRRTPGLRREEVAGLASMSADYLTRLEQRRDPQPSPQLLAAIAQQLLVHTATPGSDDADKLRMLGVVGRERFDVPAT